MEALTRLETLRQLILEGNRQFRWFGSMAIQKAVYLVESVYGLDLGYPYGLHHLGPYSPELTEDLQLGEQVGLWMALDSETESSSGRHYEVSLAEWPEDVADDVSRRWLQIQEPVRQAFADFHELGLDAAKPFELVATIHYLRHVQAVPAPEVPDMLRLLKPRYSLADIQSAEELLGQLESAAAGVEIPKPVPAPTELHLKLVPPMDPEPEPKPVAVIVPEEKPKSKGRQKVAPAAVNLSLFEGL